MALALPGTTGYLRELLEVKDLRDSEAEPYTSWDCWGTEAGPTVFPGQTGSWLEGTLEEVCPVSCLAAWLKAWQGTGHAGQQWKVKAILCWKVMMGEREKQDMVLLRRETGQEGSIGRDREQGQVMSSLWHGRKLLEVTSGDYCRLA